jgi:hypothetical protein
MNVKATQASDLSNTHCSPVKGVGADFQQKAQFEQLHSAWLTEQNQRFESHGLWCADMRVW